MRHKRNIAWLGAALLLASCMAAQTRSWQNVQELQPGTPISMKAPYRVRCAFVAATEEQLECEQAIAGQFLLPGSRRLRFERRSIREVRLERVDAGRPNKGDLIGAGVGAGIGAAIGGTGSAGSGKGALCLGVFGAAIGAGIGHALAHGEVIYRQ